MLTHKLQKEERCLVLLVGILYTGPMPKGPMRCTVDGAWHACMLTEAAFGGVDVPRAHQTEALPPRTGAGVDDSDSQGTEISAHIETKGTPSFLSSSLNTCTQSMLDGVGDLRVC